MLSESPRDELKIAEKLEERLRPLKERMDRDYGLFRLTRFKMPDEEGSWDNFTANTPAVLAHYIINLLSTAKKRLYIPIDTEAKRERKMLSNTERAAIGIINLADEYLTALPTNVDLQSGLAWDGTVRGITVLRFFLYQESGEVVPDLAVWDFFNTSWRENYERRRITWAAYHYYLSEDDAQDLAGDDTIKSIQADGTVKVTNIIDEDEEGLLIGDSSDGTWLKKKSHGLDHVPVSIVPVGATRLVHSDAYSDTIADFGESCFALNRTIYEAENRLWTYFLTAAGSSAKSPVFIEYDSMKQHLTPANIKVNPIQKGAINLLDTSKGQKYAGRLDAPNFNHVQFMLEGVSGQESMGGVPPVAMGNINASMPVGTMSQINHSAQSRVKPVKKAMERQYEWLAREVLQQYVNGKFGKITVSGVDKKAQDFQLEVERKAINPKWKIRCEITPTLPVDEMQNMGMAEQAVKSGLLSPMTARDRYHLAEDADLEQEKINRFMAENDARVRDWELAEALWNDKKYFQAMVILNSLAEKAQAGQKAFGIPDEKIMPGGGPVQGIPQSTPPSPQGSVAPFQSIQVPPEVQQAIRMKQMGIK